MELLVLKVIIAVLSVLVVLILISFYKAKAIKKEIDEFNKTKQEYHINR